LFCFSSAFILTVLGHLARSRFRRAGCGLDRQEKQIKTDGFIGITKEPM